MHFTARSVLAVTVLGTIAGRSAHAQHAEHTAPGAAPAPAPPRASGETPMRIYRDALGPFARPVTTRSADAQTYFNQAMQLQYAFTPDLAARSFREAERRDAACAMCFWGEAWALGAYLNEPMDSADAPRAVDAVATARRLARNATPVERALIDAMATRYERVVNRDRRRQLDSAYANAMARVYAQYPGDPDVGTLYAEALMLLEPRRGSWDVAKPSIQRIHEVLEGVLAADIRHPGACHLYIHATESTVVPARAEACAAFLGSAIPGASHINHMPSHTFNRVGRWGESVRANIRAWHSDQRAAADGEGFAIYPSHNLHMLLFAASMDGQGAVAMQAARDYARMIPPGEFYVGLTMLRFGRFDEILELHNPPTQPVARGLWDFARGYAQLRGGRPDSARALLDRVEQAARTTPDSITFRGHTARRLLGVTGGMLRAELLRSDGRLAESIAVLEAAVALEDSLQYDEPEPLNFSARDWLGAALLEAGRAADAEMVYRAALLDHPRNGWSLFGLEQALRAQGRAADADAVHAQFEDAWARADTWLRASRF